MEHENDSTFEVEVNEETAQADFERFVAAARVDRYKPRPSADKRDFEADMESILYYIKKGVITVDDDGWPTVETPSSERVPRVKFGHRPNMATIRAMDRVKKDQDAGKTMAVIGKTVGIPPAVLDTIDYQEFEVVQLVFLFFLG